MARNITIRYNVDASDLEASRDVIRQIARDLNMTEAQVDEVNSEFNEQRGILQRLRAEEQRLVRLREQSNNRDDVRRYNQEISRTRQEMQQLTGETQNTGGAFKQLGKFIAGALVVNTVKNFLTSSIELGAQMETLEIQFEQFAGSAAGAQKILGEIEQFAASTPFQFETLATAGRNLLAFGVGVDDVLPNLRKLGDIAAGSGNDIGELAELFGKAKVQGRLFAEDINQFLGRGIPIVKGLAESMGVTEQEVKKLVENGKVGFGELEGAIEALAGETGQYFGLTERLADSTSGKLSTLKDNWDSIRRTIGEALLPVISDAVEGLNKLLTGQSLFNDISPEEAYKRMAENTRFLGENLEIARAKLREWQNEFGLSNIEIQSFLNTLSEADIKLGDVDGTIENVRGKLTKFVQAQKAAKQSTEATATATEKQSKATKEVVKDLGRYIVNLDVLIEKQQKLIEDVFDPDSGNFTIPIPELRGNISDAIALYDDLFSFVEQESVNRADEIGQVLQGFFEKIGPAIAQGFEIASNIQTAFFQKQENELAEQKRKELDRYGLTEEQKQAINEKFAAKEDQLRQKKAQQEKRLAIFETIINTAAAIVQALPNIPLSLIAAATGATQLAVIQSQQFKKGGYTGDVGRDDVAGVVHGREFVIDAETTKQLGLRGKDMKYFRQRLQPLIMNDLVMGNLQLMRDRTGGNSDVVAELKSLKKKIGGLQIHNVMIDENGFTRWVSSRDSFRTHIRQYTHG